jgi:pyridoxamine 5'-phosphate oxidase
MSSNRESLPEPLPQEPLDVIVDWLDEAARRAVQPNANAMVVATADASGRPSARVVLCKELRPRPGYLTFFTNYESHKGRELAANPRAAAVMHWDTLHRQARVEGLIVKTSAAESDAYFQSRDWRSRLGAWASAQSMPLASRAELYASVAQAAQRFGTPVPATDSDAADSASGDADPGVSIPRPPHWGGYRLWAEAVELWVEGAGRIHERARWTRRLLPHADGFTPGPWTATRLQP